MAYSDYSESDWRKFLTVLATSTERRQEMGEAAREEMSNRLLISQVARKHELMFERVLSS